MVRYKTEVYTKHDAYTSYPNLSLEQAKAIEAGCYDEIPNKLNTYLGDVEISNQCDSFIPSLEAYENPGQLWSHSKRTDWYTHVLTGVKVKKEVVKSPDYDKPNGNGSCTVTLTVKIPLPDARGTHPNSYNNRVYLGVSKDIKLTEDQWEVVKRLGHGRGYSEGIRNLLKNV